MQKVTIKNKPVIFKNEDFQSIQVKVIFPIVKDNDKLALFNLLPGMLHNVTSKYPTEKEFNNESQRLYILSTYCRCFTMSGISYFVFNLNIPDKYALGKDYYEKQFNFFSEMIYNPKTDNSKFCSKEFEREVENLKVDIEKIKKDTTSYAFIKIKELLDDQGVFSATIYNHIDQIDKVNPKTLYDYYQEVIVNNQPLIYVMGNVNEKEIKDLCDKYLYKKKFNNKEVSVNIKNYLNVREKTQNIVEESTFNNSLIAYFYKVKDMDYEKEIYLSIVNELLNSLSSRLLNKKLRDENDLVYSSYSTTYNNFGLFGIVALINKKNEKIVREKILEVVKDLRSVELLEEYLPGIKERHRIGLIRKLDDKVRIFGDNIVHDLGIDYTSEEFYEKLLKVSAEDIVSFVNDLTLDTVYYLKEGEND